MPGVSGGDTNSHWFNGLRLRVSVAQSLASKAIQMDLTSELKVLLLC